MKFIFRMFTYITIVTVNLLAYMLVFLIMFGVKPQNSVAYARFKFEQATSDTLVIVQEQAETTDQMQTEIDKVRQAILRERAELEEQKNQLLGEKLRIETIKNEVQLLMNQKDKAEEDRMYKLAKIYDGMDQQSVANVFGQMDDKLIVSVLPKMKPANASLVLEFLPPARSAKLSKMLLGVI